MLLQSSKNEPGSSDQACNKEKDEVTTKVVAKVGLAVPKVENLAHMEEDDMSLEEDDEFFDNEDEEESKGLDKEEENDESNDDDDDDEDKSNW